MHFAAAIFTNLTQDHLDFHETMEDYFRAKQRLFETGPGVAVVNVDDPYGARLAGDCRRIRSRSHSDRDADIPGRRRGDRA